MKIEPYPKCITDLLTKKGFDKKFHEYCRLELNYEDAYEKVEQLHTYYFGIRKYKNYDSYRVSKNYRKKITEKK
jgi:hypothetical protein|tara:strand:- start:363 stop:584 length:222 start_codon:yes stop_codon:yes gene_type:complete